MHPDAADRQGNTLKPSRSNIPTAPQGVARHAHAKDEQDILPDKAPSGKATGHRKRKPGPKRKHPRNKANWMPNKFGKYPVSSAVKRYIESKKHFYAPITLKERQRKIRHMMDVMVQLGAPESPLNIAQKDILNYLVWMDKQKLSSATQQKYIQYLRDYLQFYDNDLITPMTTKNLIRLPQTPLKEIKTLSKETIAKIHDSTKDMDGWEGIVARFITLAYPYTGLRPSELRTMEYKDINLTNWTLVVSHPKGEGRYGLHRRIGILPPIREAFTEYLAERKQFLIEHGLTEDFEALIPYSGRDGIGYWPHQKMIDLKSVIERKAKIKFKIKDYRSSFCQLAIDLGADLQAVSKAMGHKSSNTTEHYYGRIRDDSAIAEIERAFMEPKVQSLVHS